jgi:hypothetical protein
MKQKLGSRKLWVAIITAAAMLVTAVTGVDLDIDQVLAVTLPIMAYILGEAWVDARRTT